MRFTENGHLQLDKWWDKIFVPSWGGGIDEELRSTFYLAGIGESEMLLPDKSTMKNYPKMKPEIEDDRAVWIWAHGDKQRDFIGGGAKEIFSPEKIAKKLSWLPMTATGNVVVWSCWAGWKDGFCEHLAGTMKAQGYEALRFWGALVPTSILQRPDDGSNQWRDVYVSDLGDKSVLPRRATKDDMVGFGPGLNTPYL
ncbi:hypothetical protein [Mesorhizobium sp. A623]